MMYVKEPKTSGAFQTVQAEVRALRYQMAALQGSSSSGKVVFEQE